MVTSGASAHRQCRPPTLLQAAARRATLLSEDTSTSGSRKSKRTQPTHSLRCRSEPGALSSIGDGVLNEQTGINNEETAPSTALLSGDMLLVTGFSGLSKFLLQADWSRNRNGGVPHSRSYPGIALLAAWLLPSQQNTPKMNTNKL